MKYKEWDDHFTVNEDVCGEAQHLETFGEDYDKVTAAYKANPKKVWTAIEGDEEDAIFCVAGIHFVNRLYYVVSNEEWKDENENYLLVSFEL